jgi:transposase
LPANRCRGHAYGEHRRVLDGIIWRLKTGAPWRAVPARYVTQLAAVPDAIAVPRRGPGCPRKRPSRLRVDRAYGARKSRKLIQRRGIRCICPERQDAKARRLKRGSRGGGPPSFNPDAYKGRNVVERAINRLKDFRAVATRYDKRGHNYLAAVTVASIVIWLL